MKSLVILDINGVCGFKMAKKDPRIQEMLDSEYKRSECSSYFFFARPGMTEFIEQLLDDYHVAFYSSTTWRNVDSMLKAFVSKRLRKRMNFIWCRDRCEFDPDIGSDAKGHATIKSLRNVFACTMTNRYVKSTKSLYFGYHNTIIIDDDIEKLRFEPPDNVIIWESSSLDDEVEFYEEKLQEIVDRIDNLQ